MLLPFTAKKNYNKIKFKVPSVKSTTVVKHCTVCIRIKINIGGTLIFIN